MKDIKVTNEIKMKVIKYFGYENEYYKDQKEFYMSEAPDDLFKFYYNCMENKIDVCDADRYANLNTVLGYDVGLENFLKIDGYLWSKKDYDLMELFGNEDGRKVVEEAVNTLGIDIDFGKWNDGEIKEYKYYV